MNNKEILTKYFKEKLGLNELRAEQEYSSIHQCEDIEKEFVKYINNDKINNEINEHGYTAKKLKDSYPLSILGAYNYLIYLRKDSKNAINKLKKGLPRK